MTFREQVESDIGEVFLNLDEFAEEHTLDGNYPVMCLLVEADAISIGETARASEFTGVSTWQATLYVRAADYTAPDVEQRITIDDRPATVISVTDQQGLRVIRLRWWSS